MKKEIHQSHIASPCFAPVQRLLLKNKFYNCYINNIHEKINNVHYKRQIINIILGQYKRWMEIINNGICNGEIERTREKNKDAMVLFLYKSHLYKDGCLYGQIYRTYLQVTRYGNCPHFANTVLPRTKQQTTACIVNSQEKWTTAIFLKIITIISVIVISIIIIIQDNTVCFSQSVVL